MLDDTLIDDIIGYINGASAEGTINGCFNELTTLNGMPGIESPEFLLSRIIEDFDTPTPTTIRGGWAHGMLRTPYQWTKQSPRTRADPKRDDRRLPAPATRRPAPVTSSIMSSTSRPDHFAGGRYPGTVRSVTLSARGAAGRREHAGDAT